MASRRAGALRSGSGASDRDPVVTQSLRCPQGARQTKHRDLHGEIRIGTRYAGR